MKRLINKRALLGLIVALAICGCQKVEKKEAADKTFTATIEEPDLYGEVIDTETNVETKTSLGAVGNVRWKQGDQVSIFAGSTINEQYQVTDASDGKTAAALYQVTGPGFVAGGEISNNVAFYPYATGTEIAKGTTGYVVSDFTLPSIQIYAKASFGNGSFPMVAVTNSKSDYNLKFKNIIGGLKLQLKGAATITSISIVGNGGEMLCGAAKVTASTTNAPTIQLTDNTARTVTLDCGDGVQLSKTTATTFIISLPPIIMTRGFSVTVTDSEGKQMEIRTIKTQTITRSNLLTMPVVYYEHSEPVEGPVAVDLGLPSGMKWASYNLGATAPEEYGDYYAWGEVEPKSNYSWSSYKLCNNGDSESLTKYCTDSYFGIVDNKTVLDLEDDVAHVNWGGTWRMPTTEEWAELRTECTWTRIVQNGVRGRLVTGPSGKSIFLPFAGVYWSGDALGSTGSYGDYWSSSVNTDNPVCAWGETLNSDRVYSNSADRFTGRSIRPVTDEGIVHVEGVSLNHSTINLMVGGAASLMATITPSNANKPAVIWTSSDTDVATVDAKGSVIAIGTGTATITATTFDGGFTATCAVTVRELSSYEIKEPVDLGLPSGLKWATCNLGATAPEEYGVYYAWGETIPKNKYDWSTYKWCNGSSNNTLIKYNNKESNGIVDNKTQLSLDDDAVRVNWGGSWRMPTFNEWNELAMHCTWTWGERNGIKGYTVTSKSNNNKYIFLPAAGAMWDSGLNGATEVGFYWSSDLATDYPDLAFGYCMFPDITMWSYSYNHKCDGETIRPVTE